MYKISFSSVYSAYSVLYNGAKASELNKFLFKIICYLMTTQKTFPSLSVELMLINVIFGAYHTSDINVMLHKAMKQWIITFVSFVHFYVMHILHIFPKLTQIKRFIII